ncbi:MAG TPA: glycosyltransferase 87 family protein [Acidimicrobiia bacterium]|nr:glycosyltransferase 87 family protein [Acidimicrobiia bacterium]
MFVVAGLAGSTLSAHVARGGPLLAVRWWLSAELVAWAVAWVVAVVSAFRLPRRAALPLIFGVAVALRMAALAGPPTTTDDFYRYSWDGRVQAAGISPYEYTPSSPSLAHLRESWLWPRERPCPLAYRPDACTRINRPAVHTIYPPVAEAWFAGIYGLTGIEARWKPWQVAGLLTDVAVVALLAVALRRSGKDPRWCALYALCPAPVLEMVNNAHVDGLAILLSLAAFVVAKGSAAVSPEEAERRPGADGATSCAPRTLTSVDAMAAQPVVVSRRCHLVAGGLVGLAALVKLYPALLVLAFVAAAPGRRSRCLMRIGGAATVVITVGYLPHLLRVGTKVVGFLPGYLREEHYDGAGRYLVAGGLRVPGGMAAAVSALALVGAAVWVWRRRPSAPQGAAVLMGTLLLAASPVQPWYAVTLLAFATLAAEPKWVAVVLAGYPYFFAVILLHPQRTGIGQLAYGLAAATIAAVALLRVRRARPPSMERCPPKGC